MITSFVTSRIALYPKFRIIHPGTSLSQKFKVQLLSELSNMNPAKKQYEVKYKKIQLKDLQFDQGDNVGSRALTLPQRYFPIALRSL